MINTKQKIRNFIEDNFMMHRDPDTLDENASLLDQGLIDSTGVLELVAGLEEMFHIKIDDDEIIIDNLGSLNKMATFCDKKVTEITGVADEV